MIRECVTYKTVGEMERIFLNCLSKIREEERKKINQRIGQEAQYNRFKLKYIRNYIKHISLETVK